MPRLGAHMSISGRPALALERGVRAGCGAIQFFSRNRVRWEAKPLTGVEIEQFHRAREETSVEPVAVHASYLINPASDRDDVRKKSLLLLKRELKWAEDLAVPFLVLHPGAHRGDGLEKGLERIAKGLDRASDSGSRVTILLETTSGQGTNIGHRFEHLAEIIDRVGNPERLGVCFDTCHVFSAGYDFRTRAAYNRLFGEFDRLIGLERLRLFHVNDSKGKLGAGIDRHEHPGKGHIGLMAMSMMLNDPRFSRHAFLLETPKGIDSEGKDQDVANLNILRNLIRTETDDSI